MAEDKPSIHIDSDWKRQAQEEKRRLAEQARQAPASPSPAAAPAAPAPAQPGASRQQRRAARETPQASFAALVESTTTQVLLYLGDVAMRGAEPMLDLDMAKYHIDMLQILEEKTRNNLSPEEQRLLDTAMYEVRMRFISIASQVASYP